MTQSTFEKLRDVLETDSFIVFSFYDSEKTETIRGTTLANQVNGEHLMTVYDELRKMGRAQYGLRFRLRLLFR